MKNKYVLNHNYGYGEEVEREILTKLTLRDVVDLRDYIDDLTKTIFNAKVKNGVVKFSATKSITRIIIERM